MATRASAATAPSGAARPSRSGRERSRSAGVHGRASSNLPRIMRPQTHARNESRDLRTWLAAALAQVEPRTALLHLHDQLSVTATPRGLLDVRHLDRLVAAAVHAQHVLARIVEQRRDHRDAVR